MTTWNDLLEIDVGDYLILEESEIVGEVTCIKKRGPIHIVLSLKINTEGYRNENYSITILKGEEKLFHMIEEDDKKVIVKCLYS